MRSPCPIEPFGRRVIAYIYAYDIKNGITNTDADLLTNATYILYNYAGDIAITYEISMALIATDTRHNTDTYSKMLASLYKCACLFKDHKIFESIEWQPFLEFIKQEFETIEVSNKSINEQYQMKILQLLDEWRKALEVPPKIIMDNYLSLDNNRKINETYFYSYRPQWRTQVGER